MGDIFQLQQGYLDPSSTELLHITRPFAKSLLVDTIVDSVSVSRFPKTLTATTSNMVEKGTTGTIHRMFLFIAQAFGRITRKITPPQKHVDGVGTISPVRSENFMIQFGKREVKVTQFPNLLFGEVGVAVLDHMFLLKVMRQMLQ